MTRARDNSFNPLSNQTAGKNFIINGAFDFWQRGTSFAAAGAASTSTYTADRWNSGANSNITISRVSATTEGTQYALRLQKNSGTSTGGDAFVCHTIESSNATLLAGKIVTLSFNVRKGADFSGSAVYCVPRFGTATDEGSTAGYNGQFTGTNQIVQTVSPTTTMTNYSKTFTVPSGTKEIMLLMGVQGFPGTSAGANDWIEFEKIQLEVGSNATHFSRAGGTIGGELSLCQRYYQKSYDLSVIPGTSSDNGNVFGCRPNGGAYLYGPFKTSMRISPSVTVYSPATGTINRIRNYNTASDEVASVAFIGETGFKAAGTTSSNDLQSLHFIASAEL